MLTPNFAGGRGILVLPSQCFITRGDLFHLIRQGMPICGLGDAFGYTS